MKLSLFILLFLLCAIISGTAHAEPFITSHNPQPKTIEDIADRELMKSLRPHFLNKDGSHVFASRSAVRAIDGHEPAIQISGDMGYMELPPTRQQMKEHYTGR